MKNKTELLLIVAIAILIPLFSAGQDLPVPPVKMSDMHHETFSDDYLPNAHDNKKTSPGYKSGNTPALKLTSTNIFTTQVNVNEGGENILDDAANEPNIAVNPLNENSIVIGWRQFDNVSSNFRQAGWGYTSDAGQNWTFPGVLEPGVFRSDPVLDYDADGNFYYNSLRGDLACKVFKSTNGGAVWDNGTDAGGGDKQWMAIDRTSGTGSGSIYSFWSPNYSTCPPGFFTRSWDAGFSFESCTSVNGDPYWGTMAITNTGDLYIGGGADEAGHLVVVKSLNAQVPGSAIDWEIAIPVFIDGNLGFSTAVNPAGLLGQVNIDADRSDGPGQGNVYLLATVARLSGQDPGDVMFVKSTDGGLNWSEPARLNDDPSPTNTQWLGTMSVAPDGRIDVIWLDTRDAPPGSDSSALYYTYSIDQGNSWSVNEKLSASFDPHVGYPNQEKMGDYFDMVSFNSGAHLAWANTLNGEQDVYYSHIIPESTVGMNEIPAHSAISLFPNPTSSVFIIKNELKQSRIEICTSLGQKLFEIATTSTINEIDISPQPAGIYFVKIVNGDGSAVVKKVIRE